ncbi:unnamed protein product [Clonostachys byssicola]|uniref:Zn(2)-C6 fungal-type domain-containing protein n=1 Tax=Clonostachys byssicola TaxID=160290 RepID=A0A9N9UZT3_9HYPO|nr:unnamed protein product [Clonostachys byssicola]
MDRTRNSRTAPVDGPRDLPSDNAFPAGSQSPSSTQLRKSKRSFSGCRKCREKKVKCDETHPRCKRCIRFGRKCDYTPLPRKPYTRRTIVPTVVETSSQDDEDSPLWLESSYFSASSPGPWSSAAGLSQECAQVLTPFDHGAIQAFRCLLPLEGDSGPPEYSGPNMIWTLACRRSEGEIELERILAALWLMIIYELKFGDGCGVGLSAHLQGVGSLVTGQLHPIQLHEESSLHDLQSIEEELERDVNLQLTTEGVCRNLSPLSCRIMVWMALFDGGAVMNGLSGAFDEMLGRQLPRTAVSPVEARLEYMKALQQRSSLVGRYIWGRSYPQQYLVDDLQNCQLSCLYTELGQLRFLLGTLIDKEYRTGSSDHDGRKAIANGIKVVGVRYRELLQTANHLDAIGQDSQKHFAAMSRFVIAFYHAVVLCFLRVIKGDGPSNLSQRESIQQIISLALKAYRHHGQRFMTRLAWSLFVTAIESDDMIHREWILERFNGLTERGENYRRAREALLIAFKEQEVTDKRISYTALLHRSDVQRFII